MRKKKFGWYQANCEKKMSKNKQKYQKHISDLFCNNKKNIVTKEYKKNNMVKCDY